MSLSCCCRAWTIAATRRAPLRASPRRCGPTWATSRAWCPPGRRAGGRRPWRPSGACRPGRTAPPEPLKAAASPHRVGPLGLQPGCLRAAPARAIRPARPARPSRCHSGLQVVCVEAWQQAIASTRGRVGSSDQSGAGVGVQNLEFVPLLRGISSNS